MIVPMKKITIITQSKDRESTLESVRNMGLLHIEHQTPPASESIDNLNKDFDIVKRALSFLPDRKDTETAGIKPLEMAREALDAVEQREELEESIDFLNREIETWKDWGDFDPDLIDDMRGKGLYVQLCRLDAKQSYDIPEGVVVEKLFIKGNTLFCAAISRKEIKMPFETFRLPDMGLGEMTDKLEKDRKRLEAIDKKLYGMSRYKQQMAAYEKNIEALLKFHMAMEGMGRYESLSYVKGYCPFDKAAMVEKTAGDEKWGILIEDAGDDEMPPTLIRNPKWVEIIKPVFKMINTIPGYKEVDISPFFLIFLCIFFGMLIGDAGYGLVFLLTAFILGKRSKDIKDKAVFFLAYILSACAILWGIFTGTFFGQTSIIKPVIPYFTMDANVQSFCFFIGAVQLSIAHAWKFLRKMPSLRALSDAGWILILWGAYFLAKALILGYEFSFFGKWLFIAGTVFVIFFTKPAKNILKAFGAGAGDFLLKIVNSFTDVVSYIRLFAVGVAGVAVANSFNEMALGVWHSGMFGFLGGILILLFGHALNLALGMLAILVHGVRLNVLEFSGHLDIEWSGVEYTPFKEA